MFGWGLLGAFAGGITWVLLWQGYNHVLAWISPSRIFTTLYLMPCVGIGYVASLPVSWLLKRIPRRGFRTAGWAGGMFAIAAAIFGETLYVAYLLYKVVDVINLEASFELLPRILQTYGFLLWIGKLTAVGSAIAFAYNAARPRKRL
jgi:hypothetical protein